MKKILKRICLSLIFISSCSTNFYEPFANKKSTTALLEKTKMYLDEGKYDNAYNTIEPVVNSSDDSNEARLLYVSATMGVAGLDMWTILTKIVESSSTSTNLASTQSSGMGGLFDQFSETFLGTGETREKKLAAIALAISALKKAPIPTESKLVNLGCFLSGILAIPRITDLTTNLETAQSSLQNVFSNKTGSGSSASECPDIDTLNTSIENTSSIANEFSLVLDSIAECPFLKFADAEGTLNTVQTQLQSVLAGADKGCADLPTCSGNDLACQALGLGCVQSSMDTASAVEGDGKVSSCEFLMHCYDPTNCFSL